MDGKIYFDPDSPLLVAEGTLGLAVVGAATGGVMGALRAQNPFALGMNMGLNGAVAGLVFFGVREYLISPLLVSTIPWPSYTLRRETLRDNASSTASSSSKTSLPSSTIPYASRAGLLSNREHEEELDALNEEKATLRRVRNDRLLDSAVAAGLTGGGISAMFRGKRTFPKAFITSGLIVAAGQYFTNNLKAGRLELLASRRRQAVEDKSAVPIPSSVPASPSTQLEPTSSMKDPTTNSPSGTDETPGFASTSERLVGFFKSLSPVRKISDQEYLDILLRQRKEMEDDLQAWETRMKGKYALEGRGTGSGSETSGSSAGGGSIDVGQLMRQLDGVERRIKGLESKISEAGETR